MSVKSRGIRKMPMRVVALYHLTMHQSVSKASFFRAMIYQVPATLPCPLPKCP